MANRRVLVKRRKAVTNIRKITRTMQLIATARFQAAYTRATATKPYTAKLEEMAADLSRAAAGLDHPLLAKREEKKRVALVVITSNRGLCGGYNANILRTVGLYIDQNTAEGVETDIYMIGKKGISFFTYQKREMLVKREDIDDRPRFEQVEPLANELIERFMDESVDGVSVAYMKFHSAGKQSPVVEDLLPLSTDTSDGDPEAKAIQYEFSPTPKEILDELLPATVRIRFFQAFTDAAVSEQIARMVAMTAATDAAGDMIKRLTRDYNRARQTHITMELLDIVGGANALE